MYKSLVKALDYILTQSTRFLYTGDLNPSLSDHLQHIILYCFTLAHELYSGRRFRPLPSPLYS